MFFLYLNIQIVKSRRNGKKYLVEVGADPTLPILSEVCIEIFLSVLSHLFSTFSFHVFASLYINRSIVVRSSRSPIICSPILSVKQKAEAGGGKKITKLIDANWLNTWMDGWVDEELDSERRTVLLNLVVVLDRHCGGCDFFAIKKIGVTEGEKRKDHLDCRLTCSPKLIVVRSRSTKFPTVKHQSR